MGPQRRAGNVRVYSEQFSGIPNGAGFVNSNSLRSSSSFSSRFTLQRAGASFRSGDWARVQSGRFETRDTNGWLYLTTRNVIIAGFQNMRYTYRLNRFR